MDVLSVCTKRTHWDSLGIVRSSVTSAVRYILLDYQHMTMTPANSLADEGEVEFSLK